MANPNSTKGIPAKGVSVPAGGKQGSSKHEAMKGGVALGMKDKTGKDSQFKGTGTYNHVRTTGDQW